MDGSVDSVSLKTLSVSIRWICQTFCAEVPVNGEGEAFERKTWSEEHRSTGGFQLHLAM